MTQKKEAHCKTIVDITPDELMVASRHMHLAATKAQPGQQVLWDLGQNITLKYDPKIKTSAQTQFALPGTQMSETFEKTIQAASAAENAHDTTSH